jgi:hypothetical protein
MINVLLPTAASPQKTTLYIRLNKKRLFEIKNFGFIYSNGRFDVICSCGVSVTVDPLCFLMDVRD